MVSEVEDQLERCMEDAHEGHGGRVEDEISENSRWISWFIGLENWGKGLTRSTNDRLRGLLLGI